MRFHHLQNNLIHQRYMQDQHQRLNRRLQQIKTRKPIFTRIENLPTLPIIQSSKKDIIGKQKISTQVRTVKQYSIHIWDLSSSQDGEESVALSQSQKQKTLCQELVGKALIGNFGLLFFQGIFMVLVFLLGFFWIVHTIIQYFCLYFTNFINISHNTKQPQSINIQKEIFRISISSNIFNFLHLSKCFQLICFLSESDALKLGQKLGSERGINLFDCQFVNSAIRQIFLVMSVDQHPQFSNYQKQKQQIIAKIQVYSPSIHSSIFISILLQLIYLQKINLLKSIKKSKPQKKQKPSTPNCSQMQITWPKKQQLLHLTKLRTNNFPLLFAINTIPQTHKIQKLAMTPKQSDLLKKIKRTKSIMIAHKNRKQKNMFNQYQKKKQCAYNKLKQKIMITAQTQGKTSKTIINPQYLQNIVFPPVYTSSNINLTLKKKSTKSTSNHHIPLQPQPSIYAPFEPPSTKIKQPLKPLQKKPKNNFKITGVKYLQKNSIEHYANLNFNRQDKYKQQCKQREIGIAINKKNKNRFIHSNTEQSKIKQSDNTNQTERFDRWEFSHWEDDRNTIDVENF